MKLLTSIFPRQFGFFPYIFLVYTIMPFLTLLRESGIKQVIGYGMLIFFVMAYRQLFCSVDRASFTYWLIVQMAVIFIYSVFYNITYIYLGFSRQTLLVITKRKQSLTVRFAVYSLCCFFHVFINYSRIRSRSGSFFLFSRFSSSCSFLHSESVLCFGELNSKPSLPKPTNR